jgi:H/ACA ribonucleoprotein complex subunit 4
MGGTGGRAVPTATAAPPDRSLPPIPLPPDGAFLVVDKPRGPSSHQVTAWVRDLLGAQRAGHAGTLDPGVSGVLVMAVGKSLRLLPLLLEFPKRYVTVVTLHGPASNAQVERVLQEFTGPIFQLPPVRSAVRRERRVRTIHELKLLERHGPDLLLEVQCDSGTYIRTLAVDLGEALGPGAHMAELRRVGTGPFTEKEIVSLAQLADAVALAREGKGELLASLLQPPARVWKRFPQVVVKDSAVDALAHGADLAASGVLKFVGGFEEGARVVLVTRKEELVALGIAMMASAAAQKAHKGWIVDAQSVLMETGRYPPRARAPVPPRSPPPAP